MSFSQNQNNKIKPSKANENRKRYWNINQRPFEFNEIFILKDIKSALSVRIPN